MANKAIVYAIYPNQIQDEQCQKTFGCCRFVYNQMLTIQQNSQICDTVNKKKAGTSPALIEWLSFRFFYFWFLVYLWFRFESNNFVLYIFFQTVIFF